MSTKLTAFTPMQDEIKKLKEERDRYEKAIVSLTPSGSEFVNDPEYCAKHVKEYQASQHGIICNLVIEKKKLKEERDSLYENLYRIIDRIEENDFKDCFPFAYKRAKELLNNLKK